MTVEIALVLSLLVTTVLLFVLEWLPVDVVALLLMMALILCGLLTPQEAFAGFASEIVVILASLFVISGALLKTGGTAAAGRLLTRIAAGRFHTMLVLVMLVTAGISTVMNNTVVTAVLLPALIGICRKSGIPTGRLLIPLAFASMLGGTCTLVGTSTNVAASGYIVRAGLAPFGLFEFLPVGGTMVFVGIAYMAVAGWRLLPAKSPPRPDERVLERRFLSELVLAPGTRLIGRPIGESGLGDLGLIVLQVLRAGQVLRADRDLRLEPNDTLVVHADRESLLRVKEISGLDIKPEVTHGLGEQDGAAIHAVEAMILPGSHFIRRTLRELQFRRRYGVTVLAIYRRGQQITSELRELRLRTGDVLLLQGTPEQVSRLTDLEDLWILEELGPVEPRRRKMLWVAGALAAALLAGGLGLAPLGVAFLGAAVLTVLARCVTIEEAYELVDWRMIVLIASMTTLGVAMESSGTAALLARVVAAGADWLGLAGVLAGFAALTMLLTQPMSNAAAALVILPVAISTAESLAVNPRTFAVVVTLAASLSFISPWEPSCLLVYGPGGYRFRDFMVSGLPLSVLSLVVLVSLVLLLWPL